MILTRDYWTGKFSAVPFEICLSQTILTGFEKIIVV